MAEKPSGTKTFAQFLEEQPAPAETATLAGFVTRCARPGSFSFTTGGQTLELPTDAVKGFKVLDEGLQKLVELELINSKIDLEALKAVPAYGGAGKNPHADVYPPKAPFTDPVVDKALHKDPLHDQFSLRETTHPDPNGLLVSSPGLQPFVLATPHHAPASTVAAQSALHYGTTPIWDITSAVYDRPHTLKEILKDPIQDLYTLPETIFNDPTNTAAEGVGTQAGPGQVVNPAMQAQMLIAWRPQASAAQFATHPLADSATVAYFDRPHTTPWFDTPYPFKEVAKDPITDPVTLISEQIPGGGDGTMQEGVGGRGSVVNPVWNLPGMMF